MVVQGRFSDIVSTGREHITGGSFAVGVGGDGCCDAGETAVLGHLENPSAELAGGVGRGHCLLDGDCARRRGVGHRAHADGVAVNRALKDIGRQGPAGSGHPILPGGGGFPDIVSAVGDIGEGGDAPGIGIGGHEHTGSGVGVGPGTVQLKLPVLHRAGTADVLGYADVAGGRGYGFVGKAGNRQHHLVAGSHPGYFVLRVLHTQAAAGCGVHPITDFAVQGVVGGADIAPVEVVDDPGIGAIGGVREGSPTADYFPDHDLGGGKSTLVGIHRIQNGGAGTAVGTPVEGVLVQTQHGDKADGLALVFAQVGPHIISVLAAPAVDADG